MKKSVLKKPSDIKDVFGAFLVENAQFSKGKYDMPVVRSNIDELPTSLFSYQKVGKKKLELQPKTALHFYVYDYIFDGEHGVWNALIRGTEFARGFNLGKLEGFDCIIVPDFSLYMDMPVEWQIWNVYRRLWRMRSRSWVTKLSSMSAGQMKQVMNSVLKVSKKDRLSL